MQYAQTRYIDSIASGISSTALSLTAAVVAPTRTQGVLTVGRSQGNTEDTFMTGVAGNIVTLSLRGLSTTALTPTEVVGNKKVHAANESLEITTHHLYDVNKARIDETNVFTGTNTFADDLARSTTNAAPTNDLSFPNKKYVDDKDNLKANLAGGNTFSGNQVFADNTAQSTTNAAPNADKILSNKKYVDDQVSAAVASVTSGLFASTAKEAITIGKPVAQSSTASQVENLVFSQFVAADAGTATAFDAGTVTLIKGCQAAANKVALIYRESSNWYVIAGTIAPDSKTPVWGARQSISANSAAILPGATYLAEDAVVFCYVKSDNTLKARAATLSGTVFTFDTEYSVHAATVNSCDIATVDANKVLLAFNDSATFGKMSIGTLALGVLTVDTANEQALFAANAISQISVCKAATAKGFVFFRDGTSSDGTQVAVSCGSTTPAGGAAVVADANDCTSLQASQITTDSILLAWRDGTSQVINARVASCAGTVVTNPTSELLVNSVAATTTCRCLAYSTTKAVIAWKDVTNSKETFQPISIASTTLALVGATVDYQGAATVADATNVIKVNDNGKMLFTYEVTATTDGYSRVYQDYNNTQSYVGIAQATVAAAAAVNVRQIGIDTNQAALTVAAPVVSNGITIGKALSTTSMEVIVPPSPPFGLDAYTVDIGNTDAYVFPLIPPTPTVGMEFNVKFLTANTGASTANALAIKKVDGNDTVTGDITANMQGTLRYNGSTFTLMSPTITALSTTGTGTAAGGGITKNVDVVITTGFRPSLVEVSYYLIGYASGAQKVTIGTVNFNSSLAISGGIQLLNNVAIATPVDGNTLSTTPTLHAGGVAGLYSTTDMSLFAISDTGFTLRFAFVDGGIGGAYSQTYAYKAWK